MEKVDSAMAICNEINGISLIWIQPPPGKNALADALQFPLLGPTTMLPQTNSCETVLKETKINALLTLFVWETVTLSFFVLNFEKRV